MSSFCICKSYSHFFSKHTCELDIILTRTVNILTTKELVKLTMLCTTGPWSSFFFFYHYHFLSVYSGHDLSCDMLSYGGDVIKSVPLILQPFYQDIMCDNLSKSKPKEIATAKVREHLPRIPYKIMEGHMALDCPPELKIACGSDGVML